MSAQLYGFRWAEEPAYASVEDAVSRLADWEQEADALIAAADQELPQVERFRDAVGTAKAAPERYTPEMLHGTEKNAVPDILADGALRPSRTTETDQGEIGDIPVVFSTPSPGVALIYTQTRPTPDDVYTAVEKDILGRPLQDDERNPDAVAAMIDDALETGAWLYDGQPLDAVGVPAGYQEDLELLYRSTQDRLDELTDELEPVVLGYDRDAIDGVRGSTTLYRNEVGKDYLAEVQSDAVTVDADTTFFVPPEDQEEYEQMVSDADQVASLDALKAMHWARNAETYREQMLHVEPVWDGPVRATQYTTVAPYADKYDLTVVDG